MCQHIVNEIDSIDKKYKLNIFMTLFAYLILMEEQVFNFFDEIKRKMSEIDYNLINSYNIVNMSGKLLYVEGHCGLTIITDEMVAFKVKDGRFVIEGKDFYIKELTENTLLLQGSIIKVEKF